MYNCNTDSLGLILGVEVFFSGGHCSGALWILIYVFLLLECSSRTGAEEASAWRPGEDSREFAREPHQAANTC